MKMQNVRGTQDILPEDNEYWIYILNAVNHSAEINGFEKIDAPLIEYLSLFEKGTGQGSEIVNKQMFEVSRLGNEPNDDKDKHVLRPEITPSMVRAYINHGMREWPQPVQLYSWGPCFRYERPQAGRLRQFHQVDFESFGASDPATDARMISLVFSLLKDLRIKNFSLEINTLGCSSCKKSVSDYLKSFFNKKKAILCDDCLERLSRNPLRILDCKKPSCKKAFKNLPPFEEQVCEQCKDHFLQVKDFLKEANVSFEVNNNLVRGLDYYTRTVFEVSLKDDKNKESVLLGGGRYDGLFETYGEKPTPAIGFAFGIERVVTALKAQKIKVQVTDRINVFVAQLGEDAKRKALTILEWLKTEGISARAALSKNTLKSQLKLADKLKAEYAIIIGQREVLDGTAIIRSMKEGVQEVIEQEKLMDKLKTKLNK
jgi:histidyl-tRNA synthetase